MKSEFDGLTALVTGAGSGIGLAVAQNFFESGAKVYGFDLQEGSMRPFAHFIKCDIGEPRSVNKAFTELADQTSVIDILVNNAGIGTTGTVEDLNEDEWQKILNVNVLGTARVSAASMPLLRRSKFPAIVNTCSIAATAGLPGRAIYSASKGAIMSLTLSMAADSVKEGIRINCVNPGTADTPWVERLLLKAQDPVTERAALESRQPLGRLVSANEVASAILYLASPRQASTTGTILAVDGGMQGLRLPK